MKKITADSSLILFMLFVIVLVYGCEENCCGDTLSFGDSSCFKTRESCRDTANFFDCSSWKFRPGPTEFCEAEAPEGLCTYDCCCKNAFGLRSFEFSTDPPFIRIMRNEDNCDLYSKGDTTSESSDACHNEFDYRICNSFEFLESEDGEDLNGCFLYECEDCSLE